MNDWTTYFKTRLTENGYFVFEKEAHHGEMKTLVFKSSDADNLTTIMVGVLDDGELITIDFNNPLTPGFNKQQQIEHFYEYSFHPTKSYGGPGLEFTKLNIDHFDRLLRHGLKGREVQYFKRGRLIKSEIYQSYGNNREDEFGSVIWFEKRGVWDKLREMFKSKDELHDKTKEIELKEIFSGIGAVKANDRQHGV